MERAYLLAIVDFRPAVSDTLTRHRLATFNGQFFPQQRFKLKKRTVE